MMDRALVDKIMNVKAFGRVSVTSKSSSCFCLFLNDRRHGFLVARPMQCAAQWEQIVTWFIFTSEGQFFSQVIYFLNAHSAKVFSLSYQ